MNNQIIRAFIKSIITLIVFITLFVLIAISGEINDGNVVISLLTGIVGSNMMSEFIWDRISSKQ